MKLRLFKRIVGMMLPALLMLSLMPMAIFAADSASQVEIRLKAGRNTVTINGVSSTVEAPFVSNGTTMVPLKVITNAFGAGLKLENGNTITLTYNDKKVVLTFGSKTVKVNGAAQTVTAAPVVIKGSTMVPLRIIVETFGAKISSDNATKETVINGQRAQSANTGETSIDADFNKTKVGDSYYNWSMNYPAGLVQVEQSSNGDFVRWADAKEAAQVYLIVSHVGESELTSEEQRNELYGYFGNDEYVIDKRTITVGERSFEKLVAYSKQYKTYYEYRGIQQGEFFYAVIAGVQGSDRSVLKSYDALLNSFVPAFNKSDSSIKDITKLKDGYITYKDADFGLTVQLPAGWYSDSDSATPMYYSQYDSLFFTLSSLVEGDTLEQWAARREAVVRESFAATHVRNITTSSLKLKDGNALVLSYEYTYDLQSWTKINEVLLISGNYRYAIDYYYEMENSVKSNEVYKKVMASLDIDTAFVEKNFDQVEDESDFVDRTKKVTKRSSQYGYSVEIPAFWYGYQSNFEKPEVLYTYSGGEWSVQEHAGDAASLIRSITEYEKSSTGIASGVKIKESSTVTINGKTAQYLVINTSKPGHGLPFTEYVYMFDTGKTSMIFLFTMYDAYASASNLQMINDVAQSIRIN